MRRVALYIVVSFGFSWTIALLIYTSGGLASKGAAMLLLPYMLGPGVAGLICTWRYNAGHRRAALGFEGGWNLWLLWAWVLAIAIVVGATRISLLDANVNLQAPVEGVKALSAEQGMPVGDALDIPGINLILIAQAALLGAAINVPLMLSEELGWRGWLWHELRPKGFWIATFWIGLLWGLWHIPIIALGHNYPGMPIWGPVLFTLFCILYAPIFSYVRERNGSVWGPCVLHGTGNACAGMAIMMQTNADMPWRGVVGIGGFVMVTLLTLWVWNRRRDKKDVTLDA